MHSDTEIAIMRMGSKYNCGVPVAVFDLDGTLTVRDAVVPFLIEAGGKKRLALRAPGQIVALAKLWLLRDRDGAKLIATRVMLAGVERESVEKAATTIAARITRGWMRDDVLARLRWHQESGHHTIIVSASYSEYVRLVGDALGVDHVIASELEFDDSGICTGGLRGGNCRGQEKADRLKAYLESSFGSTSVEWCYGDSSGDNEMLDMAANAIRVHGIDVDASPEGALGE